MRPTYTYLFSFLLLATLAVGCKTNKTASTQKRAIDGGPAKFKSEADKMYFDNLFFDATKAKLLGRNEEAIGKFKQCLKINDKVADVYYQLYLCYVADNRQGAIEMLNKGIDLDPKNEWYLYEKAEILRRARRHLESAQVYNELIELNAEKADYYDDAVEQLVMGKKVEEAIKVLDKMEAKFGLSEDIIRRKEEMYLYLGKPKEAIAEVKKLAATMPNNTIYMGMLAELYAMTGETEKAFELFNTILTIQPNNGKAHFGLAGIYRQKRDSSNTIKQLMLGFEDDQVPTKEKINVILSIAPLGDNDTNYRKQVLQLADILVKTHPSEPEPHAIYADLLFGNGQFKEAAEEYEVTVGLDANNFKVWQQLLSAYEQMGNYSQLEKRSDAALELFPNRVIFYYYNANGAYRQENYKKAASTAQAGIDLGIGDKFVNVGLYTIAGDAYYKLKDYGYSFSSFDEALIIDPENAYVLNNYAYYLSQQGQRLSEALAMAKKALDQQPANPAYMDTYGWVLYKNGKYTDAQTYIQKALDMLPTDRELLEHMGDVQYQLGNKNEALVYWKKSKENGNNSAQLEKKINEGILLD